MFSSFRFIPVVIGLALLFSILHITHRVGNAPPHVANKEEWEAQVQAIFAQIERHATEGPAKLEREAPVYMLLLHRMLSPY